MTEQQFNAAIVRLRDKLSGLGFGVLRTTEKPFGKGWLVQLYTDSADSNTNDSAPWFEVGANERLDDEELLARAQRAIIGTKSRERCTKCGGKGYLCDDSNCRVEPYGHAPCDCQQHRVTKEEFTSTWSGVEPGDVGSMTTAMLGEGWTFVTCGIATVPTSSYPRVYYIWRRNKGA